MCGLFPCIPILGVFVFDQRYYENEVFCFCVKLIRWLAAKHITKENLPNCTLIALMASKTEFKLDACTSEAVKSLLPFPVPDIESQSKCNLVSFL